MRPSRRLDQSRGELLDCACFWAWVALNPPAYDGFLKVDVLEAGAPS